MAISRNVFHNDGEGKQRTQATSHTSIKTLNTRSHNSSPTSSDQIHVINYYITIK